jgi:hypothetical protein
MELTAAAQKAALAAVAPGRLHMVGAFYEAVDLDVRRAGFARALGHPSIVIPALGVAFRVPADDDRTTAWSDVDLETSVKAAGKFATSLDADDGWRVVLEAAPPLGLAVPLLLLHHLQVQASTYGEWSVPCAKVSRRFVCLWWVCKRHCGGWHNGIALQ